MWIEHTEPEGSRLSKPLHYRSATLPKLDRLDDDIVALVARFELAFAESKSAVLTAGPNEYLVSFAVETGADGAESNPRHELYKNPALPLSYTGAWSGARGCRYGGPHRT